MAIERHDDRRSSRLHVEYDPGSGRYYLVDEDGNRRPNYDSSGRPTDGYDSQSEAQQVADETNRWADVGYNTEDPSTGETPAEQDQADYDSATDPAAQQERLDRGEARSGGYYDPAADDRYGDEPAWVRDTAGIPLIGGPADAWRAQAEAERTRDIWEGLSDYMPTANDLAVDYEQDPGVLAGWTPEHASADQRAIDAQGRALQGYTDIYNGEGFTDADRARMQLGEMEVGRQMRASRDADLAALQARGLRGSGAEIASMLGAQQSGADSLFARDAQLQEAAQQRAMDALAGMGSLGSQMRGQSFDESSWNASEDNNYNRWNTDYERDRSRWNTEQRNATRESRSQARQQAYENRERQAAGMTDQWSSAASGQRQDQERNDENARAGLSGLAELLDL